MTRQLVSSKSDDKENCFTSHSWQKNLAKYGVTPKYYRTNMDKQLICKGLVSQGVMIKNFP